MCWKPTQNVILSENHGPEHLPTPSLRRKPEFPPLPVLVVQSLCSFCLLVCISCLYSKEMRKKIINIKQVYMPFPVIQYSCYYNFSTSFTNLFSLHDRTVPQESSIEKRSRRSMQISFQKEVRLLWFLQCDSINPWIRYFLMYNRFLNVYLGIFMRIHYKPVKLQRRSASWQFSFDGVYIWIIWEVFLFSTW